MYISIGVIFFIKKYDIRFTIQLLFGLMIKSSSMQY